MAAQVKTPGGLAERVRRARAASSTLSKTTDQLNAAIVDAEKVIAGLNLGVTAWVPFPSGEEDAPDTRSLWFERHRGEWCLTVNWSNEYTEETSITPLLECSREARVEAVDLLPSLVDALMDRTETLIGTVAEKIDTINAFTKRLREAQS